MTLHRLASLLHPHSDHSLNCHLTHSLKEGRNVQRNKHTMSRKSGELNVIVYSNISRIKQENNHHYSQTCLDPLTNIPHRFVRYLDVVSFRQRTAVPCQIKSIILFLFVSLQMKDGGLKHTILLVPFLPEILLAVL